jgi:hypothetical protein
MLQSGRAALVIGAMFAIAGIIYWFLNYTTEGWDPAGSVMLVLAGVAMTFGFLVLLRGSREL